MNRAMARAREERYQTAGEFQAALKQLRDRRSAPHLNAQQAQVVPQFGASTAVMKNPANPVAGTVGSPFAPPAPARPDPLASLPKLASSEPRLRPSLHDEESSTHLALDVSHLDESGEGASPSVGRPHAAPVPLPPSAPHEFDDIATEIHRGPLPPISGPIARKLEPTPISMPSPSTDWDDVTTRLDPRRQLPPIPPPSSDKSRQPAPKPPMKNPPKPSLTNFEDTVKIEGDLEAHFAEEIAKSRKES
jgi:hypothetical protein